MHMPRRERENLSAREWNEKGRMYHYELNQYERAIKYYDKALESNSRYVDALYHKGLALNALKRYKKALKCFDKAIEIDYKELLAWDAKYVTLHNLKRYEELIKCCDDALGVNCRHSNTWNSKGCALYKLKRYKEAIKCFDKVLGIDYFNVIAWTHRGMALNGLKRYKEAIECFDKAIGIDPKYADAWTNKGDVLSKLNRYEEALLCYDKTLGINYKFVEAWIAKGNVLCILNLHKEAIAHFDKAIEVSPIDFTYSAKGNALNYLNRYEEAIKCCDEAIKINSKSVGAWTNKGYALNGLNQYKKAIKCCDKAIGIDSKYANPWSHKGYALNGLKRYKKAIKCCDKAIGIDSKYANPWSHKGLVLVNLNQHEEAIECFDKAIGIDPKYADAWTNKGDVLSKLNRYEEALKCFNNAFRVDSKSAKPWTNKDLALYGLKRCKEVLRRDADRSEAKKRKKIKKRFIEKRPFSSKLITHSLSNSYLISHTELSFDKRDKLGEGGFGAVYRGKWKNVIVAIKQLHISTMTRESMNEFKAETSMMASLHHPSILPLYAICVEPGHYSMVMEYMPKGSLYNVLHSGKTLPWKAKWDISIKISQGIFYLHNRGRRKSILHRDLKSLNILVGASNEIKVADFGLSTIKHETTTTMTARGHANDKVGTLSWMAPELFAGKKYTKACDIYSLGMVFWEIASQKVPYTNFALPMLRLMHIQGGGRETIPTDCPPTYSKLITLCWAQRAQERPEIGNVLEMLEKNQKEALKDREGDIEHALSSNIYQSSGVPECKNQ